MTKHITIHTADGRTIPATDHGEAQLSEIGESHVEALAADLLDAARSRGVTVSELARQALERELAS
jgi:hypothetical protein